MMSVIWLVVFYRVFNTFFTGDSSVNDITNNVSSRKSSLYNFSKDTFILKKIERDPFLGKSRPVRKKKVLIVNDKSSKKSSEKGIKKPIKKVMNKNHIWPKLSYYGSLKTGESSSLLFLIKVDNQLHKIKKGDKLQDIIIKKVYRDSITVQMYKESKTILRN
ncbi:MULTISPECIES: hypothetical protein [unclassified Tamlana]|uniref:hypothetical protein n=1 Tax=unclassified Tamlana TaxID=2614803 RepID=UPI0026E321D6|nr:MULTISPECIES: hypothetical protein [unclassified Tamlana]